MTTLEGVFGSLGSFKVERKIEKAKEKDEIGSE